MSKKWASNDKDRLLVENFKKFMEEGDFSADEELNEAVDLGDIEEKLTRLAISTKSWIDALPDHFSYKEYVEATRAHLKIFEKYLEKQIPAPTDKYPGWRSMSHSEYEEIKEILAGGLKSGEINQHADPFLAKIADLIVNNKFKNNPVQSMLNRGNIQQDCINKGETSGRRSLTPECAKLLGIRGGSFGGSSPEYRAKTPGWQTATKDAGGIGDPDA